MNVLAILMVFVVSFAITLIGGAGWSFVLVYLPALLMLNQLPQLMIPHAPLMAHWAALYGLILGLPFRREPLRLRWCTVDTIVVLLLISVTITAWTTEVFETGINSFRTDLLQWTIPYFLARMLFRDVQIRRRTLNGVIVLVGLMSVAALIEFRLWPYWYLHLLQNLGMNNHIPVEAYSRYGFFRVAGTVDHPIYFGNMCVALLGLIAVLARTSGLKLSTPWVALGLFGAFGCVITSISFTPYMGMLAGGGFFLLLVGSRRARMLLVPIVLVAIIGGIVVTYQIAQQPLGERPQGNQLEDSMFVRRMIVIESWKKAVEAGPFGFGLRYDFVHDTTGDDDGHYNLASVDNSYMQFTMTRGWVYTALWLSIAVFFAGRMTIAFSRVSHRSQVVPLALCTATVLGLMVSMYTVWAGGLYTVVWLIVLGLSNTLIDLVLYPELRQVAVQPAGAIPSVRAVAPAMGAGSYGGAAALAHSSGGAATMQHRM